MENISIWVRIVVGSLMVAIAGISHASVRERPLAPLPDIAAARATGPAVELGKMLYFDKRLSGDGSTSCASCHEPELGWGDGNALSRGYPGTVHWRNSQSVLNMVYLDKYFWTGSSETLEAQAKSALTGPLAQNMNAGLAEERLKQIPAYVALFRDAYGSAPTFDNILAAISSFERTLISKNVPFDRFMKGDQKALNSDQKRGLEVFKNKARCVACHNGAMFTDEAFHNLGVPVNAEFESDPLRQIAMRERIKSKGIPENVYLAFDRDPGRYLDTKLDSDKGKFRTPTLRELRDTGPYMHNGVFATLDEVIDFYDAGGGNDPFGTKSTLLKPLGLTRDEKASLRAFLESLNGDPIRVTAPRLPDYAPLPFPVTSPSADSAQDTDR